MEKKTYRPQRPKLTLQCPVCNTEFERHASEVRVETPCCSTSCAIKNTPPKRPRKRVVLHCEKCSAPFEVKFGRSHGKKRARFCSVDCRNIFMKKEKHPRWKKGDDRTWQERCFYKEVVESVGRCEICSATGKLHAHHIKHRHKFPELALVRENLLVLCPPCHADQHPEIPWLSEAYRAS